MKTKTTASASESMNPKEYTCVYMKLAVLYFSLTVDDSLFVFNRPLDRVLFGLYADTNIHMYML